jgi:hypothetical protein
MASLYPVYFFFVFLKIVFLYKTPITFTEKIISVNLQD